MEKTSQIREIVETAVINLKQAAEVNTIIGKPIMTEQGTIMPVSQMTFAFVAGGGEYGNGSANRNGDYFAGATGGGAALVPIGFLVVGAHGVKMIRAGEQSNIEKLMDVAKDVIKNAKEKISLIFLAVVLVGFMFSIKETRTAHAFPACSGKACAVIEVNSGKILYEKNADARLPMASTTKIATAITVIENCDISMTVKVPQEAQGVEGSSIYLKAGETLTVKELLYGLMLQSGNDSAVALAVAVGGSVENFAEMMNKTARKCGAENTHFVNPHGLHDDKHYTTAHDLALISVHAMKNPEFRNIVSAKSAEISNEGTGHNRIIYNKINY